MLEPGYKWMGKDEKMLQKSYLQIRAVAANKALNTVAKEVVPLVRREIATKQNKQNKLFSLQLTLRSVRNTVPNDYIIYCMTVS